MRSIIVLLLLCIGWGNVSYTQTLRQYKKEALKAFLEKDYYAALAHYDVVLEVDSSNIDYYYKHAESARKFQAYSLAERSYQKVASSSVHTDYPETDFWLATMKKNLGKYDEAATLYERYVENSTPQAAYYEQAKNEIEYLKWASEVVNSPSEELYIQRLGMEVNTEFSEVSPYLIDSTLYYASFRFENKEDDHYPFRPISKVLRSENGQAGVLLPDDFNAETQHTSNASLNHDGSRIYYTICDYKQHTNIPCEIYYRNKNADGSWAEAIRMPEPINLIGTTSTQPSIVYDEDTDTETLYFVSDRAGGLGGRDIWYAQTDKYGVFGRPQNLEAVNTPMDDITPFYHTASDVLYFSSEGHKNLGGFDIYKIINQNGRWGEVEHMGFPLNSSYNDTYYMLSPDETKAYFASNRLGSMYIEEAKEACCNDIYEVELNPILINILATTFDKATRLPLNGVNVQLLEVKELIAEDKHEDDNEYKFEGRKDKQYVLIATRPNYLPDTIQLSTFDISQSQDIAGELYLRPISLDLLALTFDDTSKDPVLGASITLQDCDGNFVADLTNKTNNDFLFDQIKPENCYELVVTHLDYHPKTIKVTVGELLEPTRLEEKIYLELKPVTKATLDKYLPMPLFFDNDHPNPRTTQTYTDKQYKETVNAYLGRIPIFKEEYGKGLRGEQKIRSDEEIQAFFDKYVIDGYQTLDSFTNYLVRYIEQGNTAELMIRGFASPLASTEYNENLTKRRVNSILNHLRFHQGGVLEDYIRQGRLKLTQAPHGELLAAEGVSDDPTDRKNSVYSPQASRERRVEIIEIKVKGKEKR